MESDLLGHYLPATGFHIAGGKLHLRRAGCSLSRSTTHLITLMLSSHRVITSRSAARICACIEERSRERSRRLAYRSAHSREIGSCPAPSPLFKRCRLPLPLRCDVNQEGSRRHVRCAARVTVVERHGEKHPLKHFTLRRPTRTCTTYACSQRARTNTAGRMVRRGLSQGNLRGQEPHVPARRVSDGRTIREA